MDIRSELEHANVYTMDREVLTDDLLKKLSQEHKVLIVCDIGKSASRDERKKYVEAMASAAVITDEQIDGVIADQSLAIVVPFHSLEMAERLYRHIPHASHFVSIRLDGEPYATAC